MNGWVTDHETWGQANKSLILKVIYYVFNIIQKFCHCSFRVGSPPSSGASLGSDQSEMIRRALEFGGPSLADEIIGSPEIGSAVRYV